MRKGRRAPTQDPSTEVRPCCETGGGSFHVRLLLPWVCEAAARHVSPGISLTFRFPRNAFPHLFVSHAMTQ